MDCTLLGSSVHEVFQARILEWVAISFCRGPSWSRNQTCISCVSCIGRRSLYLWATWKALSRVYCTSVILNKSFPDGSVGKESTCNAGDTGDTGSIPGSGRSPGGGNDNTLPYPCLSNHMDRVAWQATVQKVPKSQTRLNTEARISWIML